jgi:hypothetical protein
MTNNHDWLSLVNLSGLLVSEPVLNDVFPDGPPTLEGWQARRFRTEYERWQATQDRGRWTHFILGTVLGYDHDRLRAGMSLPPEVRIELTDYMQRLSPDRVLMGDDGDKALLVYFADGGLDKPETVTGRWKASPFTKLDRLLRETRVPLGLLTNGDDWRLVYAAPGLTTSSITWNAATWMDESLTLRAFRMLLGDPARLQEMASESQQRQADVTDQLGNQVLRALAILVHELDRADAASEGDLLVDMTPEQVYEMALVLLMRLVFMLYAEENSLLPHGEVFYDQGYGLTYLWNRLERERREDPERFPERRDAWPRLLATFNLIYDGSPHKDFTMPAYRGSLFDPGRFPALLSADLRINNQTIWRMLRHLTTAENRDGRQRVSYRTLNVEQLGYVYEGLLGYTVKVAKEWMIDPEGGLEPFAFATYQDALAADDLYEYLKTITEVHWTQARSWAEDIEQRAASGSDDDFWVWEPVAEMWIAPGRRYLAPEMGTRKRGGIFYTPPQLTSFLVEQALEPQCYTETGEGERPIRPARDILALTVCDPAMGSGAFLVQAVRYLGNRLLEAWDAATAESDGAKLVMPYAERAGRALEDVGPIPADRDEALVWARRLVAERCIFGVDLNALAVELAKLSLWLVTLSKDKPFTFLDHRLRHGNSLIGASFLQEIELEIKRGRVTTRGTVRQIAYIPDEALTARKGADKAEKAAARERIKVNQSAREKIAAGQMSIFADMSVEQALAALADRQRDLTAPTTRPDDYRTKETLLAQVLHQGDYPRLKEIADLWCAVWFWPRDVEQHGPPPTTQEYHDTVYTILDLPAIITTGQPRLDRIRATARDVAAREHFFHWELAYPAIFTQPNPGFDAMCSNPPWETVEPNSQEFFEAYEPNFRDYNKQTAQEVMKELTKDFAVAEAWNVYVESQEQQATFFKSGVMYTLQGTGKVYTYMLFLERIYQQLRNNGEFGTIVKSGIFSDKGATDLRKLLLYDGSISYLFGLSNERFIFPSIHHAERFALIGFSRSAKSEFFPVAFRISASEAITAQDLPDFMTDLSNVVQMPVDMVRRFSPDTLSIMNFRTQTDADVTAKIYDQHPLLGESQEGKLNIRFTQGFNMTTDSHLFNESGKGLPLYEGKMIWHYDAFYAEPSYWIEEKIGRGASRESHFMSHESYRLAFRRIANCTNERTLVATIVPRFSFIAESLPYHVSPDVRHSELLYLLSILNAFVLDYIIRQKISANLSMFYLYQLPVPRLTEGEFFDALVPRAARLTCTTPHFADLWQAVMGTPWDESTGATGPSARQRLRDEIDALVAHLYGLSRADFEHILGTFPLVFPATDAGHAKRESLLAVYDEYAELVKGWDR